MQPNPCKYMSNGIGALERQFHMLANELFTTSTYHIKYTNVYILFFLLFFVEEEMSLLQLFAF
jgi:hypothetical protein